MRVEIATASRPPRNDIFLWIRAPSKAGSATSILIIWSELAVFITGPNAGVQASMHVVVISKGKDVPDSDLKLLVSSPGNKPLDIDYNTDVKRPSSK